MSQQLPNHNLLPRANPPPSQQQQQQARGHAATVPAVPDAPYPPMMMTQQQQQQRFPSTQIRSALSTSPHYNYKQQQQAQRQQQLQRPGGNLGLPAAAASSLNSNTGGGIAAAAAAASQLQDDYTFGFDQQQQAWETAVAAAPLQQHRLLHKPPKITTTAAYTANTTATALIPRVRFVPSGGNAGTTTIACINCDSTTSTADTTNTTAAFNNSKDSRSAPTSGSYSYSSDDDITAAATADTTLSPTTPVKGNLGSGSRKATSGPVLLELRKLQLKQRDTSNTAATNAAALPTFAENSTSLFETVPLLVSRGNLSLGGPTVTSTCLDVAPPSCNADNDNSGKFWLQPCATGLSNGALCIHSFTTTNSSSNNSNSNNANMDWTDVTAVTEYYQSSRNHRAATAVAWRPSSSKHHVAIGLVGTNTVGSGGGGGGGGNGGSNSGNGGSAGNGSAGNVGIGSTNGTGTERPSQTAAIGSSSSSSRRVNIGTGASVAAVVAASGGRSSTAADREYCCYVWDVEYQGKSSSRRTKTTPLYKLAHQTGVASLAWLLDGGQTLAVGGQLRNLHLCDLRLAANAATPPPVTVYAHANGVHGIEMDPARSWHFATFCRTADEPVKLWDARRMDAALSEIKVSSAVKKSKLAATCVSNIRWSAGDPGTLSIAVGDTVYDYDTSASRPVHTQTVYTEEPMVDFCLYPAKPTAGEGTLPAANQVLAEVYPNRMLAIFEDRTVRDLPKHTIAPVSISRRDGRLVHGHGRTLWLGSTSKGPSAMESLQIHPDEDISATMMRRARCLHVAKYSMNTTSNIKMLAQDGILAEEGPQNGLSPTRAALLRLWSWINRVEELCGDADEAWDDGMLFSPRGLVDAGAWHVLRMDFDNDNDQDVEIFSDTLACPTFNSAGRRAALSTCGWAGKYELANVLGECEDLGEYERSAALAAWHGDIGAAVEALQRGADSIRAQLAKKKKTKDPRMTSRYAETLELVSLSVAGYRGGDTESSTFRIWSKACTNLMQRNELSSSRNSRSAYLRGLMRFLLTIGFADGHQAVLGDDSLSLCDRVAFACHFLGRSELKSFLGGNIDACVRSGNVEGIVITGIEEKGVAILQSYVDRYADVQTAALITSRVIFPADWAIERQICSEWLYAYRSLLNTWQMWQSRAMFDVDRADLLRKIKVRQNEGMSGSGAKPGGGYPGRRAPSGRKAGLRQPDPDILPSPPAQLDARCNYCSSPLGLKLQDSSANQWLSKMKPVLSCCPQCRKPLPRCSICMLSLGALNPYMELTKERSRSTRGGTLQPPDDLSSLANFPFAEWFTWCMRCKHGGHAHHLVGWFANHETCPVSGCDCRCQFDGIEKLNRPALSRALTSESDLQQSGRDDIDGNVQG